MRSTQPWECPPLSTDSTAAEACYRHGIAALVAGIGHAGASLAEAVALDPTFFLALVGVGAADALAGRRYEPPPVDASTRLRGERQHAEIVASVFAGEHRRAADLRREHLLEYPGDILIVWLPLVRSMSP